MLIYCKVLTWQRFRTSPQSKGRPSGFCVPRFSITKYYITMDLCVRPQLTVYQVTRHHNLLARTRRDDPLHCQSANRFPRTRYNILFVAHKLCPLIATNNPHPTIRPNMHNIQMCVCVICTAAPPAHHNKTSQYQWARQKLCLRLWRHANPHDWCACTQFINHHNFKPNSIESAQVWPTSAYILFCTIWPHR